MSGINYNKTIQNVIYKPNNGQEGDLADVHKAYFDTNKKTPLK